MVGSWGDGLADLDFSGLLLKLNNSERCILPNRLRPALSALLKAQVVDPLWMMLVRAVHNSVEWAG